MDPGVVVGVHAHAEPVRLVETVRSVQAGGGDGTGIVLLPDGPDAALSAALTAEPDLAGLPQWGTAEPLGPPACFNRLASRSDTAVVVLVESGTVLGPRCLRLLVAALTQPGRGLAGPLHQPLVERAGGVQPSPRTGRGRDRRAGAPALRSGGALAGAAAQPGGFLPGRRAPGHRGDRRGR